MDGLFVSFVITHVPEPELNFALNAVLVQLLFDRRRLLLKRLRVGGASPLARIALHLAYQRMDDISIARPWIFPGVSNDGIAASRLAGLDVTANAVESIDITSIPLCGGQSVFPRLGDRIRGVVTVFIVPI